MASSVVMLPFCSMALVVGPISSMSEGAGDAPCGVGWAHIIDDARDSTTLVERRGPTCGQGRPEPMEGAIAREG